MERIAILGCAGSGKSTLAANISRRTGVPVIHLDDLFYRRGWTVAPEREAQRSLDAAIAGQRWVIDGNFLAAGAERFRRAQAVVFLDRSPAACLRRVLRRRLPFAATRGLAGLPARVRPGPERPPRQMDLELPARGASRGPPTARRAHERCHDPSPALGRGREPVPRFTVTRLRRTSRFDGALVELG